MPRRGRLPYEEGDVFAVPLRGGGYGLGVVTRMDGNGVALGYFSGRRYNDLPDIHQARIDSDTAGRWTVLGRLPRWSREDWPMPAFGRREEFSGRCFRVEYADDNPGTPIRELPIAPEECDSLPEDGLVGFAFVEERLGRLVSEQA
jgi:hypothetical protein